MHGHATPHLPTDGPWGDPRATRIAHLSEEYLSADAQRRDEIGREIAGLIAGNVVPFRAPGA